MNSAEVCEGMWIPGTERSRCRAPEGGTWSHQVTEGRWCGRGRQQAAGDAQRNEAVSGVVHGGLPCNEQAADMCCGVSVVQPDAVCSQDVYWHLSQTQQPHGEGITLQTRGKKFKF